MINVNQITSQLAKMPDQALQQYAAMHKNDPYTVALALAESNRRKEIRTSAQMDPGQQPKVVDQEIAAIAAPEPQMLPEDTGIAQLPAQNIQGMAGGGIVAFEAGGEVPRFQNTGLVQGFKDIYNMTPEEIKEAAARKLRGASATDTFKNASVAGPEAASKTYLQGLRSIAGKALGPLALAGQSLFGTSDEEMKTLREADARRAMQGMPESTIKGTGDTSGIDQLAVDMAAQQAAATTDADKKPDANKKTDGPVVKPPADAGAVSNKIPAGSPLANAAAKAAEGIDTLLPAKEKGPDKKELLAEREAISKPVYEKAEGMINKEKSRLNEGREQDFYMALIEGGLAAAASDSPNGIQNLAKGFSQGAKSYSSALKDFRKAAQENSKMELDIERAKAADKRNDLDAFEKANESAKNRAFERDKLETQGRFQLANTNLAGQFQLQASANSAAAQLAAAKLPGAQERLFASLGGGDVTKGLKLFQEAQTDKTGLGFAKIYMEHLSGAKEKNYEPLPEREFIETMSRLASQMNPKVVSDPKGNVLAR
jgi:hypothetical protein